MRVLFLMLLTFGVALPLKSSPVPPFLTLIEVNSPFLVGNTSFVSISEMSLAGTSSSKIAKFKDCDGQLQAIINSHVQSNAMDGGYTAFAKINIKVKALSKNSCTDEFVKSWRNVSINTQIPVGESQLSANIPNTDKTIFSAKISYSPIDPKLLSQAKAELKSFTQ